MSSHGLAPSFPLTRFTLENGLRVVLGPDACAPAVAVVVSYDVGFRSEPEGRTGFAHLFEHLMFEGSVNLPRLEHSRLVESVGGSLNASTRPDCTLYVDSLPSNGLELGIFLEADRMRGLRLTEEVRANVVAVVKEEIRGSVLGRPYGGFPWIQLPPVLFDTFANRHNGYGGFEDIDSTDLPDAADFFDRYYCPSNAVVALVGDFDPEDARALVGRYFGQVEPRPAPARRDLSEPLPTCERRGVHHDPLATQPALAIGYRVPDPVNDVAGFVAAVAACALLVDGESSRLQQRLVRTDQLAFRVSGQVGMFDTLDSRDPTFLQLVAYYGDPRSLASILTAVDEEVDRLAAGVAEDELELTLSSLTSAYLGRIDGFESRATLLAVFEQQRSHPSFLGDLVDMTMRVTPSQVSAVAATWLRPSRRAVLVVEPGARR